MAAIYPTSPAAQAPPDVPSDPSISGALGVYLRSFALWCRHGFQNKLDAQTALPGIMLQAYDAPPGTAPNVFLLRVNQQGQFVGTAVPLGGGKP